MRIGCSFELACHCETCVWQRLPRCTGAPASARTFVVQMSAFDPYPSVSNGSFQDGQGRSSQDFAAE
jgi:hypothetical protein